MRLKVYEGIYYLSEATGLPGRVGRGEESAWSSSATYTVPVGSQPSGIFNHVSEALTNCGTPTLYQQEQYNCDIRHHLQKY